MLDQLDKCPRASKAAGHAFAALCILLALFWGILMPADECRALEPDEIIVVANSNTRESIPLALYYMRRRNIPYKNMVVLSLTDKEFCSREEYEQKVAMPIRMFLRKKDPLDIHFRCILTIYGVPLTVSGPGLSLPEKAGLLELKEKLRVLRARWDNREDEEKKKHKTLKDDMDQIEKQISSLEKADRTAAVDSEIALVREKTYPLAGWVPNPSYLGYKGMQLKDMPARAFLVSRLDGPSPHIVRRMVDNSLAAEETGLKGKAYFDARWPDPGKKELSGYAFYDRSLHHAAEHIKKSGKMAVVLNEKERLFQSGECPDAALYSGWYSLGKYVDAFAWVTGAVGYHIASSECTTLKEQGSNVWCKAMLEKGVAATLGPVGEPYVQAFPPPELFFGLLTDGRLTLAECFALSSPFLSWKMVLIGDPLYRPFKNKEGQKKPAP